MKGFRLHHTVSGSASAITCEKLTGSVSSHVSVHFLRPQNNALSNVYDCQKRASAVYKGWSTGLEKDVNGALKRPLLPGFML